MARHPPGIAGKIAGCLCRSIGTRVCLGRNPLADLLYWRITEQPAALAEVDRNLGPITILVNDAAILIIKGVLEHAPEEWDQVIETDLNANFLLAKYAAQLMVGRRAGKIIDIASEYSIFGSAIVPSYLTFRLGISGRYFASIAHRKRK